jgi:hypothetical protein
MMLQAGQPLPNNATVVTVDDGYRDFYEVVDPVLRRLGLAAMVFLTTNFVDGKDWLWFDKLQYCIQHTQRSSVVVFLSGNEGIHLEPANTEEKVRAHLLPGTWCAEWRPRGWSSELAREATEPHTR